MKKILLFSLFLVGLYFFWMRTEFAKDRETQITPRLPDVQFEFETSTEPITVPKTEPSPLKGDSQVSRLKQTQTRGAESGSDPPSSPPLQIRPPGTLRYELDGKWVVVYGDVLLGQPEGPKKPPPTGFVKTPPLRTWESREIPYFIAEDLPAPQRVMDVIDYFNRHTPIRFVPFEDDDDAVVFMPAEKHCRSYLGRIGGHQPIFLSNGCGPREITHEIMHALGFVHEHTRPDRDRYVRVHWEEISEQGIGQFEVVPEEWAELVEGRPFDYQSVMIYGPTLFAKVPGTQTLESITAERIAPISNGLSREDIERLYRVYGHLDP